MLTPGVDRLEMCDCILWLGGGADSHPNHSYPIIRFPMTKYLFHDSNPLIEEDPSCR